MKSSIKRLIVGLTVSVMSLSSGLTAFAGEWKQNDTGWWYQKDDGTWYSNGWQWIDGNNDGVSECYYFDANGYMLANTTTPDGYRVNADGAWVEHGTVQRKSNAVFKAAYMSVDYDTAFVGMTYSPRTLSKDDKATSVIYVVPSTESEHTKCGVTLSCADRTKISDDTLNGNIKKTLDNMATSISSNKQYKDFDINGKHWRTVSGNYVETDGSTGYMISAVTYDANRAYMTTYIADLSLGGVPMTGDQYLSKFHITNENVIWTQADGNIN